MWKKDYLKWKRTEEVGGGGNTLGGINLTVGKICVKG